MWWVCVSSWWFLVCWESQRVFSFWSSDPLISLIRIFIIFVSYNTQKMGLVMWFVSAFFIMLGPFPCKLEAFKIQAHVPKELIGLMLVVTSYLVLFPFSVPQVTQKDERAVPSFTSGGSTWLTLTGTGWCASGLSEAIMAEATPFEPRCIFC